jgi:hypothetical protein
MLVLNGISVAPLSGAVTRPMLTNDNLGAGTVVKFAIKYLRFNS